MPRKAELRENYWDLAPWLKRAAQDFCKGTGASTPAEAIKKGERTLEQWCEFLIKRREEARLEQVAKPPKRY